MPLILPTLQNFAHATDFQYYFEYLRAVGNTRTAAYMSARGVALLVSVYFALCRNTAYTSNWRCIHFV